MKTSLLLISVLVFVIFLSSCENKCVETIKETKYEPVYLSREILNKEIKLTSSRIPSSVGKIYYKDNFIFINEINEGVHVIDNSDPRNPVNIGFITIPGNKDIAIKGSVLYAENYSDLVSIDISDPKNVSVMDRVQNIFPPDGAPASALQNIDPSKGVVVDWKTSQVEYTRDCNKTENYY